MRFQFDDGGRAAAGYKGVANDCATLANASGAGRGGRRNSRTAQDVS